MKPEMKKLIIANLPYLLFVYLFGKLGQAYRLAEGIDLSQKLLHFADGCAAALESAAPSFHPIDLLIGVAGAAALRLMVYCKGKNAKLCTVDRYPSDSFVFSSHGYDLHIDNELVADAFANLPQQEQSILILYCVLDMADGEIASLTGMSRSAVQRHRTKTLKELRVKLMALMPEGG